MRLDLLLDYLSFQKCAAQTFHQSGECSLRLARGSVVVLLFLSLVIWYVLQRYVPLVDACQDLFRPADVGQQGKHFNVTGVVELMAHDVFLL